MSPGGRLVTCGAHSGEVVPIDVIELFRSELTIIGSRTCTRAEIETVVDLVGARKLNPVVDSRYPLADAQQAFRRMDERLNFGKIVLIPEGR